jgi:hypothetical protein
MQHRKEMLRSKVGLSRLCAGLSWVLVLLAVAEPIRSETPTRKIVGLGATTCERFSTDIATIPSSRKDYLAWAQGYMSGILLGRPVGIDDDLDLAPSTFGLRDQLEFLEDFCARNAAMDYSDAVEALYRRLRADKT